MEQKLMELLLEVSSSRLSSSSILFETVAAMSTGINSTPSGIPSSVSV